MTTVRDLRESSVQQSSQSTARGAVVSGATTGIGRATALELARRGWRVYAVGRRAERLEELQAQGVGEDVPGMLIPCALDVTDADAVARIAEVGGAGQVRADQVAEQDVAGGARAGNEDAEAVVAADDVAGARRGAADGVAGGIVDGDAVAAVAARARGGTGPAGAADPARPGKEAPPTPPGPARADKHAESAGPPSPRPPGAALAPLPINGRPDND